MTDREWERSRQRFLDGTLTKVRLGGYAGTITLLADSKKVRIVTTKPKRKRVTLTPNTLSNREAAVIAAEKTIELLQSMPSARKIEVSAATPKQAGLLTPRDIWLAYLELRLGPIPRDQILSWGRKQVTDFLLAMEPSARQAAPSVAYIYSILVAARGLNRVAAVPLDADISDIEPGTLDTWAMGHLNKGGSAHTPDTYLSRFQNVVRTYKEKWPRSWNGRPDPTIGTMKLDTAHIEPPEIGEERASVLLETLRWRGEWRAYAAAAIAHATARRVGSISAVREGMHLDAPPLCAGDFERVNGELQVIWRANAQKGRAYKRGDVVQPANRALERVYRWLTIFHANPLGPDYPLIWDEKDPARAESYDRLSEAMAAAWKEAFNEKKPHGLAWHSFCRTTITTLVDKVGVAATAEYTGRSADMVARTYRRRRAETMRGVGRALDEARGERPRGNRSR